MKVKGDSWNGQPKVPTKCPNLRSQSTGGFLSGKHLIIVLYRMK
jgi:hypothetical protein